jgi:hypothetical protein
VRIGRCHGYVLNASDHVLSSILFGHLSLALAGDEAVLLGFVEGKGSNNFKSFLHKHRCYLAFQLSLRHIRSFAVFLIAEFAVDSWKPYQ